MSPVVGGLVEAAAAHAAARTARLLTPLRDRARGAPALVWGAEPAHILAARAALEGDQSNRLGDGRGGAGRAARCASACARPPLVAAGVAFGAPRRAVAWRCAARARATSPCARCRCGPTWPRTSRPTTTPTRSEQRTHFAYPIVADRVLGLGELPTLAPAARAGADRARTAPEWRALDRVLVWTHWSWFAVPHGTRRLHAAAPPAALPARRRDDLRGVRHRRELLLADAHGAAVVRRRRARAPAAHGGARRCGG